MTAKYHMDWDHVFTRVEAIHDRVRAKLEAEADAVYGVPRGGAVVAGLMRQKWGYRIVDQPNEADVIVDDIIDSGRTRDRLLEQAAFPVTAVPTLFEALVDKTGAEKDWGWVVFPWEERDDTADVEDCVVRLLEFIGEDPTREGLAETPKRFVKALGELTAGLGKDPAEPLAKVFDEQHDEVVCVKGMPFASLCEHHLLGFNGHVHFAYVPDGKVVGLSKIPRMVEILARRPQVQERLTTQIAEVFTKQVKPLGVMVVVHGTHNCMQCRGVRSSGAMVTSVVRGCFKEKPAARAEAMALMGMHGTFMMG